MKLIKTANGKRIKLSRSEWESIGKTAGWMKTAEGQQSIDKGNGREMSREYGYTAATSQEFLNFRNSLQAAISTVRGLDYEASGEILRHPAHQEIKQGLIFLERAVKELETTINRKGIS